MLTSIKNEVKYLLHITYISHSNITYSTHQLFEYHSGYVRVDQLFWYRIIYPHTVQWTERSIHRQH